MKAREAGPDLAAEFGLDAEEYARAVKIMGREPNLTELGIFSVMWSEHCSYKSSKNWLQPAADRRQPRSSAGRARMPASSISATALAAVFKMESHNHPSFIEPYQGAATGVGGILRDVFTMGARPIANLNALRFGSPDHPEDPASGGGRGRRDRRLRQLRRRADGRRRVQFPPDPTTATSWSTR